ncbi:MAG: hypothetical protein CSA33_06565 [Desulfobulbus propionicus]|nr:MAG: hypothetical protein CSA33_06565 [Desulfobulbus propionicus]
MFPCIVSAWISHQPRGYPLRQYFGSTYTQGERVTQNYRTWHCLGRPWVNSLLKCRPDHGDHIHLFLFFLK